MKRFAIIALAALALLSIASTAMGAVGWCGNIWPNNGVAYTSADNIDTYVQIWKDGCTGPDFGPCADLEAYLYYRCVGDVDFTEVPMTFNGFVGNNDEFTGQIPAGHGCAEVEYYIKVVDTTDMTECYGQDQAGNDPNFILPITAVLAQDVTVTFTLCLTEGVETAGNVCVVGAGDELGNWSAGIVMNQPCPVVSPKLYSVDVMFLAGSNPYREYKYQKDDCTTWEGTGNHSFNIDDSMPTMTLPIDGWEWNTPDCPDCASPVEESTWTTIKAIYR